MKFLGRRIFSLSNKTYIVEISITPTKLNKLRKFFYLYFLLLEILKIFSNELLVDRYINRYTVDHTRKN